MKALITGASGFVGNHLARLLIKQNVEVWGTTLHDSETVDSDLTRAVSLLVCDIRDRQQIDKVLKLVKPDYVFHLAAQSSVGRSWDNPSETIEINVLGTAQLLDGLVRHQLYAKTVLVGSAEEYGKIALPGEPILETTTLNPVNPYGVSKAAVSMLFGQYVAKFGLPLVYARAFNHIGPGQGPGFVTVDFAKRIAEIERCHQEPLMKVGNLDAKRDFTDVRDVVRAYWALAREGKTGQIYNVASGHGRTIKEVLQTLLDQVAVDIKIQQSPSAMRPSDAPVLIGDINKIITETGWRPQFSIEETLEHLLEYWRKKIQNC